MQYKRQEPFRFKFEEPQPISFKIVKVNDREISSKMGMAKLLDISPKGFKISSVLDLPIKDVDVLLEIDILLADEHLRLTGHILRKQKMGSYFEYGGQFLISDSDEEELIKELKIYRKRENENKKHNE